MKKFSLHKGFTLVELMIVIAIIGILASVLYPSLMGYLERTRDTSRQQGMNQLNTALGTYFSDMNGYPANTDGKKCLKRIKTALTAGNVAYLKALPKDPKIQTEANRLDKTCNETGYQYAPQNVPTGGLASNYVAATKMEIATNGNMALETLPTGVTGAQTFTQLSAKTNATVDDISKSILTKQQLGSLAKWKFSVFAVYNQ